jgi:hypothetical protein
MNPAIIKNVLNQYFISTYFKFNPKIHDIYPSSMPGENKHHHSLPAHQRPNPKGMD